MEWIEDWMDGWEKETDKEHVSKINWYIGLDYTLPLDLTPRLTVAETGRTII